MGNMQSVNLFLLLIFLCLWGKEKEGKKRRCVCVMARSHQLDTYLIQHKRMHKSKVTIFMRARLSSAVV